MDKTQYIIFKTSNNLVELPESITLKTRQDFFDVTMT